MKRALVVAAVAFAASVGTAQAQDTVGFSKFAGVVHDRGDHATLRVKYACAPGTADHLWFSIKQSANGKKDAAISGPGSGFGGQAPTWFQSHRGYFRCDGKKHTGRFTADLTEPGSRGNLRKGVAWVQFCLTKADAPEGDPSGLVVIRQQWWKVR
jgi:hypothetical protein